MASTASRTTSPLRSASPRAAVDHLAGRLAPFGGALHGGGDLVEGRGGLFQAGGLLLGAARQVVGRRC
jgi:hypothetical protein